MRSFQSFYQEIRENSNSTEELKSKAIRNGLGIRESFWEDFLMLLNNVEAVSALLDVSTEKVGTWHKHVKESLKRVHDSDNEVIPKEKKRLLKTGLPEGK